MIVLAKKEFHLETSEKMETNTVTRALNLAKDLDSDFSVS